MNDLFFKQIGACFIRFGHFYTFCKCLTCSCLKRCNNFLCHGLILFYLISRWSVCFLRIGLYFFLSRRSGVFFLFFVVIYLEVPGCPLSLCSVHSRITCCLLPLAFFAIFYPVLIIQNVTFFFCFFQNACESILAYKTNTWSRYFKRNPSLFFRKVIFFYKKIRIKFSFSPSLGVRNVVTYHRLFPCNLTNSWHWCLFYFVTNVLSFFKRSAKYVIFIWLNKYLFYFF